MLQYDTSCFFHIIMNNTATNYSEVPSEVTNCTYGQNVSMNFRYYNWTGYDYWLAYKNDTDVNVSMPILTWTFKDDMATANTTFWTAYSAYPACGLGQVATSYGTHCNFSSAAGLGTKEYGMYMTTSKSAGAFGPFCMYVDWFWPGGINGGNITYESQDWASGGVQGSYLQIAAELGTGGNFLPNNYTWERTTSYISVGPTIYYLKRHYIMRACYNGTNQRMNLSYQIGGNADGEYSSNTWTYINDTAYSSTNVRIAIIGSGAVASSNASVFWFAYTNGTNTPYLTGLEKKIGRAHV